MKTKTRNSTTIRYLFRDAGFKLMFLFGLFHLVSIILISPHNGPIPVYSIILLFSLTLIGLYKRNLSVLCANFALVCVGPIVIALVLANGLKPVTSFSMMSIIVVMLGHGYWRIVPILLIITATFFVPFSGVDYEPVLWFRLSGETIFTSAAVCFLASFLERALIDSLNKSDALKEALEGEPKASEVESLF